VSLSANLRKAITKKPSATTFFGFVEEELWGTIGNFAINKLASGRYGVGLLYGRSVAIGGMSGSGKSLIAATICAKEQKERNAMVIWLDSEKATTGVSGKKWLNALGVDTSDDALIYAEIATIEDVKSIIADTAAVMRKEKNPQPIIVVIDSIGMLFTESQMSAATEGEVKGDQGQNPKQKKDLIAAITHLATRLPLLTISVVHTMASTDKYDPDEKLTSGRGPEYAASLVLVVNKMKLRVRQIEKSAQVDVSDREGNDIVGIRSKVQVYKSRFSQPNTSVEVQVPYPDGLDPYSGLFNLMRDIGDISNPSIGWYSYASLDGKEIKFREADFRQHADAIMALADSDRLVSSKETAKAESKEEVE
jgi:RecA/RadA recombinase